jgi:hypothetical protein
MHIERDFYQKVGGGLAGFAPAAYLAVVATTVNDGRSDWSLGGYWIGYAVVTVAGCVMFFCAHLGPASPKAERRAQKPEPSRVTRRILVDHAVGNGGTLPDTTPRVARKMKINVKNSDGHDLAGADVAVITESGIAQHGVTDSAGLVSLSVPHKDQVTLYVAERTSEPLLLNACDTDSDLEVQLTTTPGVSSYIFKSSTGHIPGLEGRFNPQADSLGRYYVYIDNASADGRPANPASFEPGRPLLVEDSLYRRAEITFLSVINNASLIRKLSLPQG